MTVATNLQRVLARIQHAAQVSGRSADSVKLLAVSKQQPWQKLVEPYAQGQRDFAENYIQEALSKIKAGYDDIIWHYIGRVQRNKTKAIAENFAWVHSIDRIATLERLARQRPPDLLPLNYLIQVNIDDEASKAGIGVGEIESFIRQTESFPTVKLRGLMVIPAAGKQPTEQLATYQRLAQIFKSLQDKGIKIDKLSMGMSQDFESAIHAGSHIVRIGTAIFGMRK